MRGLRSVLFAAVLLAALGAAPSAPAEELRPVFGRLGPIDVLGDGPSYVDVGIGAFNVFNRRGHASLAGMAELRFGHKFYFVGTSIGLVANAQEALFGYVGVYSDLAWGRFMLTPGLAIGGYKQGESIDLHETFEFRTSLGLAWRFGRKSRIGVHLAHISNAHIAPSNPGEEEIYLTYGLGF